MIAPTLCIILALILSMVFNLMLAGSAPEISTRQDISNQTNMTTSNSEDLFGEEDSSLSSWRSILNIFLFMIGGISILSFIPCLIAGIVILGKRRRQAQAIANR